jgi:hypothetical protein
MIAKPISIKGTGGKSGGCATKAVDLTSGDPLQVAETRLGVERSILNSATEVSSVLGHAVGQANEALHSRKAEQQLGRVGNDD